MSSTFRTRLVMLGSASLLSLSLVAAPVAVVAQDTPQDAIADVFTKMTEWRFAELATSFCAAQADAAAALDLESRVGEFAGDLGGDLIGAFIGGLEPETLQGAVAIDVNDVTVEMIEESESSARARVMATLAISMNPDGVRAIIEDLLGSLGQSDAQAAIIDQAIEGIGTGLDPQAIDEEIDLVIEDGVWKICSPISIGGIGEPDSAAVASTGDA